MRHFGAADHNRRVIGEHTDQPVQARIRAARRTLQLRTDFLAYGNAAIIFGEISRNEAWLMDSAIWRDRIRDQKLATNNVLSLLRRSLNR